MERVTRQAGVHAVMMVLVMNGVPSLWQVQAVASPLTVGMVEKADSVPRLLAEEGGSLVSSSDFNVVNCSMV